MIKPERPTAAFVRLSVVDKTESAVKVDPREPLAYKVSWKE